MAHTNYKSLILFFISLFCFCYSASAQGFYQEYKSHLLGSGHVNSKRRKSVDSAIKWLHLTINKNKEESKIDLLSADTVYIVSFFGLETATNSMIIWNRLGSCYYTKEVRQSPRMLANASDILNSFTKDFRGAIQKGDTAAYHKYANTHRVYDGEAVTPVIAVKTGRHWRFIVFKGNGWAINYDFEPPNKK